MMIRVDGVDRDDDSKVDGGVELSACSRTKTQNDIAGGV
jgi:hypothetical protein